MVRATDNGNPASSTDQDVTINIQRVQRPVITNPMSSVTLEETRPIGYPFFNIMATGGNVSFHNLNFAQ